VRIKGKSVTLVRTTNSNSREPDFTKSIMEVILAQLLLVFHHLKVPVGNRLDLGISK
jgi:hypothetical protein